MAGDLPETLSKADEIFVSELPTEWKATTLGRYADIRARIGWRGLSASEYTDEGPLLIAGNHIDNGQVRWDQCDHLTQERYDESPEIQLRSNDVVLSKDGTIGRIGFIDHLPGPATLNGTMMLVRPDQEAFEPRFVYHYLAGERFQRVVRERVSGSSVPHIFQRDMAGLIIPRPGRHEQQRIASALDNVDAAIDATRGVIEQTRRVKTAVLQDLLTCGLPGRHSEFREVKGLGQVPRAWKIIELGTVTKLVTSGSRGWSQYIAPNGSFFVRSQNIGLGELRYDDVVHVQPPANIEAKRAKIEPNDLLISVTGEPGNVAVATEELGLAHVSQHVALTRLKKPELARWLGVALASPSGQRQFRSKMYGQTRPGLNLDNIDELRVALPGVEERDQICEMVEAITSRVAASVEHLGQLVQAKTALSQALLTGRVRVPSMNGVVA